MSEGIATPTTIDELLTAIEGIFQRAGESKRACEFVGAQRIDMHTYLAGRLVREGESREQRDYYFPNAELAIAATWDCIQKIRQDPGHMVTREELEDGMPFRFLPARVIWRSRPELLSAPTGIVTVRMRAAFI
jgi:hypothetical protein